MELKAIFFYPVKGARGIAAHEARVTARGIEHDRRFMFVDPSGAFVTQRASPRLALLDVRVDDGKLSLSALGAEVTIALAPDGPRRPVVIWDDTCDAVDCGDEPAALASALLEAPVRLVYMPDDVVRPVDPTFALPTDRVGFADGFPLLVTTEASLGDLNARLSAPLPMDRFRPNLVLDGAAPFEEDAYAALRVGALTFRMPKRCARCVVTTIDQRTAAPSKEPLRTLATFRSEGSQVLFGQNAIPDAAGVVRVGDRTAYLGPRAA